MGQDDQVLGLEAAGTGSSDCVVPGACIHYGCQRQSVRCWYCRQIHQRNRYAEPIQVLQDAPEPAQVADPSRQLLHRLCGLCYW